MAYRGHLGTSPLAPIAPLSSCGTDPSFPFCREHLPKLSDRYATSLHRSSSTRTDGLDCAGAINAANDKANEVQNQFTGEWGGVPKVAAEYRESGKPWVVIGDEVSPFPFD